ncbi:uncharacterized protein TOT_030000955 [Theileria orientalis strain Shintoku]|uniref:Chromo domain-containing protein n=1 Tax=Theileria orientalis strain Shintoku TaxID=869250 RepID=J4C456_THEOR|nr:uncharacterized protein TOT_030000955 [Theileria orientalis strain Shintoku]PVC50583.1 hypothetical protein MACL_00002166 [Theileria orientalis]BAM41601.1 uncharacterized protein TOT_030000955 [Theileria orientalis strain Shintoku]|eukprot:XP_009691902.1 uncharacterized protein TOT_030000955 [Theileria orientalis strain Shintoku]
MTRKKNVKVQPEPEDDEFEVEDILDFKYVKGKPRYLIKWKGYPPEDNTWEPEENMTNISDFTKKMISLKKAYESLKLSKSRSTEGSQGNKRQKTQETKEYHTKGGKNKEMQTQLNASERESNEGGMTNGMLSTEKQTKEQKLREEGEESEGDKTQIKNGVNRERRKKVKTPEDPDLKELRVADFVLSDLKLGDLERGEELLETFTEEAVEVEDLLDYKPKFKKDYFLVRWKGDWEDSWEPRKNLLIVGELMNKMIDLKMSYMRIYGHTEMEDEEFVTIQSIRISGSATLSAVVVEMTKESEKRTVLPLQEVRQRWPQQLLDFLLSKLRLKT